MDTGRNIGITSPLSVSHSFFVDMQVTHDVIGVTWDTFLNEIHILDVS